MQTFVDFPLASDDLAIRRQAERAEFAQARAAFAEERENLELACELAFYAAVKPGAGDAELAELEEIRAELAALP